MRGERKPFIPTFRGNKNRESIFGHALIFVCVCGHFSCYKIFLNVFVGIIKANLVLLLHSVVKYHFKFKKIQVQFLL